MQTPRFRTPPKPRITLLFTWRALPTESSKDATRSLLEVKSKKLMPLCLRSSRPQIQGLQRWVSVCLDLLQLILILNISKEIMNLGAIVGRPGRMLKSETLPSKDGSPCGTWLWCASFLWMTLPDTKSTSASRNARQQALRSLWWLEISQRLQQLLPNKWVS